MQQQKTQTINIKKSIHDAIKKYDLKVNFSFLQQNIIALEELKTKKIKSFLDLIELSENAKVTVLTIIKLSNKKLLFNKDFNIIPFRNKLTSKKNLAVIISSTVYQKRIEQNGWFPKKCIVFKGEEFQWDTEKQKPSKHIIDLNVDTGDFENILAAYAFAKNKEGLEKGILIRKADIERWKTSGPSSDSESSIWKKWPKEMVEAKLYRKLAQELGVDIDDVDLDEKEIKENGDLEYLSNSFKLQEPVFKVEPPTAEQIKQTQKHIKIHKELGDWEKKAPIEDPEINHEFLESLSLKND